MVLADLSRGKLLDMLRSAALLCPIAHLNHVTSPVARTAAQSFIADVRHKPPHIAKHIKISIYNGKQYIMFLAKDLNIMSLSTNTI